MFELPDSSAVIPFLATRHYADRFDAAISRHQMLLSSVVAEEVTAGARDQAEQRRYDHFFDRFRKAGLIVTPSDDEWRTCGRMLSRYVRLYGAIRPRDHQNDVLILLSALRLSRRKPTVVLTENDAHFRTWLRFVHDRTALSIQAMRRS